MSRVQASKQRDCVCTCMLASRYLFMGNKQTAGGEERRRIQVKHTRQDTRSESHRLITCVKQIQISFLPTTYFSSLICHVKPIIPIIPPYFLFHYLTPPTFKHYHLQPPSPFSSCRDFFWRNKKKNTICSKHHAYALYPSSKSLTTVGICSRLPPPFTFTPDGKTGPGLMMKGNTATASESSPEDEGEVRKGRRKGNTPSIQVSFASVVGRGFVSVV